MPTKITKLTKKQTEAMKPWANKWIEIGLKTGETDWKTFDKYMPICYEKAGIKYPIRIVRVSSPLVGALAASVAEGILYKIRKDDAVHGAVSDAVDDAVGDAVGDAVSGAVSDAVHGAVKTTINIVKKAGISISWHDWLGGQFWVGYYWWYGVATVSFFFDICRLKLAKDIMERAMAYRKVCESVNYIWPNRDFVMVCARPTKIEKDERDRLHSVTGKAIEYPDGWGLYKINGITFEEELWKKVTKGELSAKEVFDIKNTEQRRIAYELMDKRKMLELDDYKTLDSRKKDEQGNPDKVISFTVKGFSKPFLYYNCICPITKREYFIQTDKEICSAAKAQSFGLKDINWVKEF